jgi:hypothetical protein
MCPRAGRMQNWLGCAACNRMHGQGHSSGFEELSAAISWYQFTKHLKSCTLPDALCESTPCLGFVDYLTSRPNLRTIGESLGLLFPISCSHANFLGDYLPGRGAVCSLCAFNILLIGWAAVGISLPDVTSDGASLPITADTSW